MSLSIHGVGRRIAWATVVGTVLGLSSSCRAADVGANALPLREAELKNVCGAFIAAFTRSSPYAAATEMNRRFQTRVLEDAGDYHISNELFRIRVPTNYTPAASWGLMVFIDPNGNGNMPESWAEVLDRRRLLWVAPQNAGNERNFLSRMRLALDAAFNMTRFFRADKERIYVAGVSGGGRIASVTAPLYPDVFRGGYYMVGCDYFRAIPSITRPNASYRGLFPRPPAPLLDMAKKHGRYVLLTGETDGNRDQTLANYRHGYQKDGFSHVTYIEVPQMGHASPDAAWFEKGLEALEAPPDSP